MEHGLQAYPQVSNSQIFYELPYALHRPHHPHLGQNPGCHTYSAPGVFLSVALRPEATMHAHSTTHFLPQAGQDPGLYTRCAEFFMEHGQMDKATKMLIAAQQHQRALEMCLEYEVVITEVRHG